MLWRRHVRDVGILLRIRKTRQGHSLRYCSFVQSLFPPRARNVCFCITRERDKSSRLILTVDLIFQIKASFGINHFQVKYFDEDNEEVRECVQMCVRVYQWLECDKVRVVYNVLKIHVLFTRTFLCKVCY